jgi:hypothetical protein
MKRLGCRLFVLSMLMGTLGVCEANAQIRNSVAFKVSSSFIMGDVTFPAGNYSITQDSDDQDPLVISASDGKHNALVTAEPIDSDYPRKKTEIIFNNYGNTLVMKQIWVKGSIGGFLLVTSHAEKKAAEAGKPTKQSVPAESK